MRQWKGLVCAAAVAAGLMSTAARAQDWQVDGTHSTVSFSVMHADVALFYGRFNNISGTYTIGENPSFNFTVQADSIDTGNDRRDEHLRGGDFFDVETYPEINFTSSEVTADGDTFHVTGDLTLHGVTKPIEVTIEKTGEGEMRGQPRTGLSCTFTINRSDYGMANTPGVGDEVTLYIGIEGAQQ